MSCRKLVIDTNVFYTLIKESPYKDQYKICNELLGNILNCCYNKICYNKKINDEYRKFDRKTERRKFRTIYDKWYKKMMYYHKFEYVEPANISINIKDVDDHKFYQTAYNTDDKIFITSEEDLLEKKDEVFENHGINTLTIKDANKIVIIDGPD